MKQLLSHMFSGFYDIVDENFPEFIILYETLVQKAGHYITMITNTLHNHNRQHNNTPYVIEISKMNHSEKLQLLRQDMMDIGLFVVNTYYTLTLFTNGWLGANIGEFAEFWIMFNVFIIVTVLHVNAILNTGWLLMDAWYLLNKFETFVMEKHITSTPHRPAYPLMFRHFLMEILQTIGIFEMIRSTSSYVYDLNLINKLVRLLCLVWMVTVTLPSFLIEHRYIQYNNFTVFPINATQYLVKQYVSSHNSLISQGYCVPNDDYFHTHQLTCLQDYFVMKRLRKIN
jgi:hypothetical protein